MDTNVQKRSTGDSDCKLEIYLNGEVNLTS